MGVAAAAGAVVFFIDDIAVGGIICGLACTNCIAVGEIVCGLGFLFLASWDPTVEGGAQVLEMMSFSKQELVLMIILDLLDD